MAIPKRNNIARAFSTVVILVFFSNSYLKQNTEKFKAENLVSKVIIAKCEVTYRKVLEINKDVSNIVSDVSNIKQKMENLKATCKSRKANP